MFEPAMRCVARGLWRAARGLDAASRWFHLTGYDNPRGWRGAIARNAELRDRFAGRRAFVLGNGSSLARQNLAPLADEITFVANAFWRHPAMSAVGGGSAAAWEPTVYSIIDPLYTDGSPAMDAFFAELRQRVTRSLFFVNLRGLDVIRSRGLLPLDRIYPCLLRGNPELFASVECRLDRPLPGMQSVALLNILAAMYAGCDPIYLLGMDHDWLASPKAECRHFYAGPSVSDHAEVEAIEFQGLDPYVTVAEGTVRIFHGHERLRQLAQQRGVRIMNATDGGFLDVYPRVRYESLVKASEGGDVEAGAVRTMRSASPDRLDRATVATAGRS